MAVAKAGSIAHEPPDSLFAAAMGHFRNGRLDRAAEACRRLLDSDPQHADALHLLGLIQAQMGQLDLAIETIGQAIRRDQQNPDYFFNLGSLLARRDRTDEALKSYDIALGLKPDFAAAWIALGNLLQRQQRFQEALLTYQHALTLDPQSAEAAEKSGKLLHGQGRLEEAAAAYGGLLAIDPNHYEARNVLGGLLIELGRFEEAAAHFGKATEVLPDAPAAFNNLGIALIRLKQFDRAQAALDRAIALSPHLSELYNTRGNALRAQNRLDEALADYDRAIALKPAYAEAHSNRGNCLDDLVRPDEALSSYRTALALDPDHGDAHWNLALNRLRTGALRMGFAEAEWRWKAPTLRLKRRNFQQPLWLGAEPIDGKVLLLHNEQGLGDAIQFCRYVPLLSPRGARVILEIDPPLKELLTGLAGVSHHLAKGETLPDFDFHCPLSSLPLVFETALDTIPSATPYLSVPTGARDWSIWLGPRDRRRIGLVWSGNPDHLNDHNRSIALASLAPLLEVDTQFVSLQKNARASDHDTLRARSDILDAASLLNTFTDTAALIKQLDLVISVDTSVAHLAGALGKRVFILLPYAPDWRWLTDRADSPWYPTARLFRQTAERRWEPVIAEVTAALQRFLA
jgi:tetratricopeptide (TPR) repeat protein